MRAIPARAGEPWPFADSDAADRFTDITLGAGADTLKVRADGSPPSDVERHTAVVHHFDPAPGGDVIYIVAHNRLLGWDRESKLFHADEGYFVLDTDQDGAITILYDRDGADGSPGPDAVLTLEGVTDDLEARHFVSGFATDGSPPVRNTFDLADEFDDGETDFTGTAGSDHITGRSTTDVVDASSGADVVEAGRGNDTVRARPGGDEIEGRPGEDDLSGDDHDDILHGGNDADRLYGNDGDDVLHGDAGNDRLSGGTDTDELYGGSGDDTLYVGGSASGWPGSWEIAYAGVGSDAVVFTFNNHNVNGAGAFDGHAVRLGTDTDVDTLRASAGLITTSSLEFGSIYDYVAVEDF
jgi:Ca2+-binding RTX toxin-like protein